MASLDSPLAKYNRASVHVETLRSHLYPISDLKSYVITTDVEDKTGYQIRRFGEVPPMPPDLDVLFGEMLYNYRSALDNLVYQLVLSAGSTPTNRTEFPIFNDSARYKAEKGGKLQGVSDAVCTIIDELQPCNSTGPNDYWWYLWYLQVLNNTDKHRHLLLTRRALAPIQRVMFFTTKTPRAAFFNVPVEKGAVFFRAEPNVDMNVEPRIEVFFRNAPEGIRSDLPLLNVVGLIEMGVYEAFRRLRPHVK